MEYNVTDQEAREGVIKRIHTMFIVIYSITFFICAAGIVLAIHPQKADLFRTYSVFVFLLLCGHIFGRGLWSTNPKFAKKLSTLLSILLIAAFPIGTLFGIIMLYQIIKHSDAERLSASS